MAKKIELLEWEINAILKALEELPYYEAAPIIMHIKEQVVV
jgi:hypothetical protein